MSLYTTASITHWKWTDPGRTCHWERQLCSSITQQVKSICCSTGIVSLSLKRFQAAHIPAYMDPFALLSSVSACSGNSILRNPVSLTFMEKCKRGRLLDRNSCPVRPQYWYWPCSTSCARFPLQLPPLLASRASLLTWPKPLLQRELDPKSVCCFQTRIAVTVHLQY